MNCRAAVSRLVVALGFAALCALAPATARGQASTCNTSLAFDYFTAQAVQDIGDVVTVRLTLSTQGIQNGTKVTINRLRFDLDCDIGSPLGVGCTDDGSIIEYEGDGTINSNCTDLPGGTAVSFSTGHATSATPNQVVFTPSTPIQIPPNQTSYCFVEFDIKVLSQSTDATPTSIEEVGGFSVVGADAQCDNGLASSGSQSGSLQVCPVCDDQNACTTESCNTTSGSCQTTSTTTCDDGDACTTESCNTTSGACQTTSTVTCDDGDACTTESCNATSGACQTTSTTTCNDGDACTTESCNTTTGSCQTTSTVTCNDGDACTTESCNTTTGACDTTSTTVCDDEDGCTTEACNSTTGSCDTTGSVTCADPSCEACNPLSGACEALDPLPAECQPVGCRITGGGIAPDGETDPDLLADIRKATFGGQVGAPCGCIGCFDEFDHVQGEWTHVRHNRKGRLHASDYNSLVCGCDGVFDGKLCNPGDPVPGPEPRPAPANMACFSGVGEFKRQPSAFRVEVEDRGEPGAGKNADNTTDVYHIRIWVAGQGESPEALAAAACCTIATPDIRRPDVDDGGNIVHGNIQIHPQIRHSTDGVCPVPNGVCTQ